MPIEPEETKELPDVKATFTTYRLTDRLPVGVTAACRHCRRAYAPPEPNWTDVVNPHPRSLYALCDRCYETFYFRDTAEGRANVEKVLRHQMPPLYRSAEFNTLRAQGRCGAHLAGVRDKVVEWAKAALQGSRQSLYLYSEPGPHGSGCGNGKTHLLWSAFKFIARRTARRGSMDEPVFGCAFVDVPALVSDFKRRRYAEGVDTPPAYPRRMPGGGYINVSFDQHRDDLASLPIMFLDDFGRQPWHGMTGDTFERIIDRRTSLNLPTFYTSNYGPDCLGARIGLPSASRVIRNDCLVVEIRAPDFGRLRNIARTMEVVTA